MRFATIVSRYAKALLDAAINVAAVEKVHDELRFVTETMKNSKELSSLMAEPFVSKTHKTNVVEKLFKDRISQLTVNFLKLLIEKNRESVMLDIYEKYHELYLEHKRIAVVTITSAVTLDDVTKDRIVNILRPNIPKEYLIETNNVIDRDIIGGFVVEYKDFQYDASVRGTVKRLSRVFSENLFVKGY